MYNKFHKENKKQISLLKKLIKGSMIGSIIIITIGVLTLAVSSINLFIKNNGISNYETRREEKCIDMGFNRLKIDREEFSKDETKLFEEAEYGYNPSLDICGYYIQYFQDFDILNTSNVRREIYNLFSNELVGSEIIGKTNNSSEFHYKKRVFLGTPSGKLIKSWDQYRESLGKIKD